MCLYLWDHTINHNESENENEKRSYRYDINRPSSRHGHKCSKYKKELSKMMLICTKQHVSNIWSSIHEKVKQHWGWVEKKPCLLKKPVIEYYIFFCLFFHFNGKRWIAVPVWKSFQLVSFEFDSEQSLILFRHKVTK